MKVLYGIKNGESTLIETDVDGQLVMNRVEKGWYDGEYNAGDIVRFEISEVEYNEDKDDMDYENEKILISRTRQIPKYE